jgi:hypothetical protein
LFNKANQTELESKVLIEIAEYAASAERYFGQEQGQAWTGQVGGMFAQMARIVIEPEWVGIMDFEQRFPSAIEAAMAG